MSVRQGADRRGASLLRDRVLVVWLALVAATIVSWLIGTDVSATGGAHGVAVAVLAVGLLKARFIGLYFMDLRQAPRFLRAAFEAWILFVFAFLVILFELTS